MYQIFPGGIYDGLVDYVLSTNSQLKNVEKWFVELLKSAANLKN